ncbi:MAG: hypothetical protein HC911_04880 [Chloroflexaceae bacterium]|nr:hypothetical protein [Chloroflexaceae bacterium]
MQQATPLAAICAKAHAGQALYFNELRFLAQTSERDEVQQMARRIRQQYAPASILTYAERAGQPQCAPCSHAHACTSLAAALELIAWLRLNLPERAHACFGVADVITLHEQTQLPTETILRHLFAAGQHRLHGDDEQLLRLALCNSDPYTDQQNPMAALWLRVLREAQQMGMMASAAVLLGADVAEATYLHWLQRIRIIQDYSQRTVGSGFLSVVYVVPMAQTSLSDTDLHRIALTRLYLNVIPHHQLRGYVAQSVPPAHVMLAARAALMISVSWTVAVPPCKQRCSFMATASSSAICITNRWLPHLKRQRAGLWRCRFRPLCIGLHQSNRCISQCQIC